jgi:DNA-directed RNA polymerase subunit RPC12/RpoP
MSCMWQLKVVCSHCAEEYEVTVEDLEDVEREACPCGYGVIVLSVAGFEPVYGAPTPV